VIKVFLNDDLLAKHLALQILKQLKRKKKLVLLSYESLVVQKILKK